MNYSLEISDLLERDLIRNDYPHEFLNKMTDEEINQKQIIYETNSKNIKTMV